MRTKIARDHRGAVTAAVCCLLATAVLAEEKTFVVHNGLMAAAASWDPSGAPGAGDAGIIGGDVTPIVAAFSVNLSGPPDAIVVRTNGAINLTASMSAEHNIVLEGGTLRAQANLAFGGTTISLRYPSTFLTPGTAVTVSGLIQDYGAQAGQLVVTNTTINLVGTVNITGENNTYSGGTVVHPGTLSVSKKNGLGTGPVELLPGSTLAWGGTLSLVSPIIVRDARLAVAASHTLTSTNRVDGVLTVHSTAATPTLAGFIEDYGLSETGRLVKTGAGGLTLNTPNSTYSGGTVVQEGLLFLSASTRPLGKGNVTVEDGAELRCYNMIEPTWPGAEVEILSNATIRLQSASATSLTNNLVVRDGGIIKGHASSANYASYDKVRIEGRVYLHRFPGTGGYNIWGGVFSDGVAPGRLVYTGSSAGRPTDFRGANTYTGGTEIEDGGAGAAAFLLVGAGRMPDTGDILIHTNGVMDFNGITDTVGSLAGVGAVLLGGATVTAAEGVSPGTNSLMAGTLRIEENGALVLGALSASTFHLGPEAGPSDRVLIAAAGGNLTLNGTLNIADLGDMEAGDYTLFDLNGGTVGGAFTATNMPEPFLGSVAVIGGDVVLTVTRKPPAGTLILLR